MMIDPARCERCGSILPLVNGLAGQCPRCLVELGFESNLDVTLTAQTAVAGDAADLIGEIGSYRIVRLIGEGGMGAVYEAEQQRPRRTVAVKILKGGFGSREAISRFEQEAQALGRLQHPHIAQIYEAGVANIGFGSQPFFAMEFVRGQTLVEYARGRALGIAARLELVAKIADGVHHAHQRGLIHRDLKPANILVDDNGQPRILDFGIARSTSLTPGETPPTGAGRLIGTLAYMSPERLS